MSSRPASWPKPELAGVRVSSTPFLPASLMSVREHNNQPSKDTFNTPSVPRYSTHRELSILFGLSVLPGILPWYRLSVMAQITQSPQVGILQNQLATMAPRQLKIIQANHTHCYS